MSSEEGTLTKNSVARERLDNWYEKIWRDGSYIHWVNPETHKLNVTKVAREIVKTNDVSIFSKWARSYRDNFNTKYKKKRLQNGDLLTPCDADGQMELYMEEEELDALLEKFVESEYAKALGEVDEDALKAALNSYQALSCERYITMIESLRSKVKRLESNASRKDKDIDLLRENIEHYKTQTMYEEKHFLGSIRNLYSYEEADDLSIGGR